MKDILAIHYMSNSLNVVSCNR